MDGKSEMDNQAGRDSWVERDRQVGGGTQVERVRGRPTGEETVRRTDWGGDERGRLEQTLGECVRGRTVGWMYWIGRAKEEERVGEADRFGQRQTDGCREGGSWRDRQVWGVRQTDGGARCLSSKGRCWGTREVRRGLGFGGKVKCSAAEGRLLFQQSLHRLLPGGRRT